MSTHTRMGLRRLGAPTRRTFSAARMSDTQWRKLFGALRDAAPVIRMRVKFVDAAEPRDGGTPSTISPHPPCIDGAALGPVESRTTTRPVPPARARLFAIPLAISLAILLPGPARAEPGPVAGLPLPSCAEVRAAALFDAALVDAFEKSYPRALVGEATVERLALDPGQVGNAAAYLACVAGLTGLDVFVAEQGLALFASRRHGRAALAALDRIARGTGPEAEGARGYARQIRAYLRGPGR